MEDYYEYLDSNGVTTLYKLIKDDTVALIDSYSVTVNGITTNLDNHINNTDIHTPITDIENMVDTKISGLVNSAPETLDTLKELSDALGNDPNFATTVANQIGNKASKDSVYTKEETNTLLEDKASSVHNHVVSDITDFPTIPTKLSQLENDMGFGTGGGSGDTSDCVHKTGNETIDGTKKFTADIVRKYTAVDITTTPASDMYAHINFTDKNDKSVAYIQYAQKTNGVDYIGLRVRDKNSNTWGVQLNTNKEFVPLGNNSYSLGSANNKWQNAHVTYTYTNRVTTYSIAHPTDDSYFFVSGGTDYNKGATLYLGGVSATNFTPGRFALAARKTDGSSIELAGSPDGTLSWGGKNIGIDDNLVHRSGAETINGVKTFTNDIFYKNSNLDLTVTPTSNTYANFIFRDKNNKTLSYLQYGKQTSGNGVVGLYLYDSSQVLHGLQITSNNYVVPLTNNTYNLGSSSAKWLSVYATTYYGNLVGSITLNQATLKMTVKDSNSETTRTNDVLLANSSNTSYGINVAFGGSGNTVVGAGESYTAQLNELAGNSQENLFLTADNNIYFKPGANTFDNAKVITLSSAAELSGLAKVTSTAFVGALTGNVTGNCSGSSSSCTGNSATATSANSATYATTQATSDNSTKIATTAWVRTYVNSVVGSGSVGASVSAYYSNATTVTATGGATGHTGLYPADYSDYINISPTVGGIYTGSQLFSSFTPTASGTIAKPSTGSSSVLYQTTATAKATFSGAFSASAKYLCTTANAVKFRAYVSQGTPSTMGSPSVVDQSSTKSIFLRIQ